MKNTYVAIMAGGIGSRFWPQSRVKNPKQFLDILGTGESLIKMTFDRFAKAIPKENIFVLTNEQYKDLCIEHLPDIPEANILTEPLRRNTAPCIAYISYKLKALNPYASLIVAPSDHLITKTDVFLEVIKKGIDFVSGGNKLLTLGIVPTRPDTGYGYIQYLEENAEEGVYMVKTFTEKPDVELAKRFIDSGDFLWNSGIFLWNVQSITEAFQRYLPNVGDLFDDERGKYNTDKEKEFVFDAFSKSPSVSIDYGVMEKANNVYVMPTSFGWSDLGTWTSLWDNSEKNDSGNAIVGDNTMAFDCKNVLVQSSAKKLVVVQGMEDCCIVDTDDALLICKLNQEKRIKEINSEIKTKTGEQFL